MANHVEIKTVGAQRFTLTGAIMLYSAGDDHHAMLHPVENRRGGWRLLPGVTATREACAGFAEAIAGDSAQFGDFVPPEILYVGTAVTAWWRPPAPARMWFQCDDKRIGTRSAITPQPGIVFMLANNRWFVYAVKGAARPTPATPLFYAPYFNIWKNSELCEGNIDRPKRVNSATLAAFERAFFGSRFTHPNDGGIVRRKGGIHALWRALLAGRFKRFPDNALAPIGKLTLAGAVQKHQERKDGRND